MKEKMDGMAKARESMDNIARRNFLSFNLLIKSSPILLLIKANKLKSLKQS
jgi:hypothetical protein